MTPRRNIQRIERWSRNWFEPFNSSKAAANHAVRAYFETFGLPATISNCCNNYGPLQFPEKIIPLFTTLALDDHPLPLYAATANRREWIHVQDHCLAIDCIINHGRAGESYNVGTGVEKSIVEIADNILETLGKPQSLKKIVHDRPGHDRRYVLSSEKIERRLHWTPRIDFDRGIRETITWYQEHRIWWEPLSEKAQVAESQWRRLRQRDDT